MEWSLSAAQDVIAAAAPEREMLVWRDVRRSYGDVRRRSARLAGFLAAHGLGAHRERSELARWECGQSPVALVMHNRCEYIESMLGCYRARAVPFNVNHHYTPRELRALLDMVGAEAIVYERRLGPLLAESLAREGPLLVDVDDGSGIAALPGSTPFEEAVKHAEAGPAIEPSPDDLYMVCTGGTTGSPKAVLWRQADIFVSGMGGSETTTGESLAKAAASGMGPWFAAPPLMHAAAQWTAFAGLHLGACIVMHDDSARFDAGAILDVAEREQVVMMSIVGDAYARPLIEEFRRAPRKLALARLATGGAFTSDECKEALLELLPNLTIVDGYGASETGGMAYGARSRTSRAPGFSPGAGAVVLSADRSRVLEAGAEEIGWTARCGRVPLGYLGDRAKTEATFPVIDGRRFSVPGDRATLDPDGTLRILGRDSMVVNTGGEKVFVEEVEKALLRHPAVADVLVVGRSSERYGQEVVAIVQLRPGEAPVSLTDLRAFAADRIARFKLPRAIAFCDAIGRHPTGKPDYQWARSVAETAALVSQPV